MEKAKKKRIKRYLTWACLAGLVLLLTVMPLLAKSEAEADGPQASVLSATVETGSITTTLRGGGTLEEQDEEAVNIPAGVKITEFLVKNGDVVAAGTPVAKVDKISVMAAISSVNDTMKYLRESLEEGRDEQVEETIAAVPGGRVKKIFAREGETVQEVMLRDGALAVLSIDSMMAVQVETKSSLATGENVEVTLQDGSVISGRVESNLDGKVVVTVEDEGYEVGQEVSVKGLGTGTLYIHNAWKATAYAGTVSKINAKEEQTLKAGAKLFTLEDRDFTGQFQYRANQHREYEQLLQALLKMQESGTIDAPCEGIISGVESDSVHLLSGDGQWEVELLSNGTPNYEVVLLAGEEYKCTCSQDPHTKDCILSCTENDKCEAKDHKKDCIKRCTPNGPACDATVHEPGCISFCGGTANPNDCKNPDGSGNHKPNCIRLCDKAGKNESCRGGENHYLSCIKSCRYHPETRICPATGDHLDSCIRSCVHAEYEGVCKAKTAGPHYEDCIESCAVSTDANVACTATRHKDTCYFYGMTYTAYVGIVDQKGSTQIKIYKDSNTAYNVRRSGSGWEIVSPVLNMDLMITESWVTVSDPSKFNKNDIVLLVTGYKNGKEEWFSVEVYQKSLIGDTDIGDLVNGALNGMGSFDFSGLIGGFDLSAMLGGFAGFGNFGGLDAEESENLHDLDGSTLMTVTPHRTMTLTITLDEQDIAKVSPGMKAKVKVEALRGQEFQGEITDVAISGTNSGGSSKFTAQLQLNAGADMLPGMSATAIMDLSTKENILVLPVEAVWELDGKTVVYTGIHKDTGDPANPVEVTTGVSDGTLVEILSGVNQGDVVYYHYYDTLEEDTSAQAERFTFG